MAKKTETFTTRWGVAGELDAAMLQSAATTYDEDGRTPWKVVSGQKGFAGLFFGDDEADEHFAAGLSHTAKKKVYLLDFDDEGSSVTELDGKKETRKRGHPVAFLKERGIVAPGFEPRPPSDVRSVYIVVGAAPDKVRKLYTNDGLVFESHPRGTLVAGNARGGDEDWLGGTPGPVYDLTFDPGPKQFWCRVNEKSGTTRMYSDGPISNASLYDVVENILGETTPDGILRALGVPRHLLYPDG